MPASDDIREGKAEAFDALSEEFLSDVTIKLAVASPDHDRFDDLLTIDSKRFFRYLKDRRNFLLEIADDTEELTAAIGKATHVRINDDIYVISDSDPVPPMSQDPTWKIWCDLFERKSKYEGLDA